MKRVSDAAVIAPKAVNAIVAEAPEPAGAGRQAIAGASAGDNLTFWETLQAMRSGGSEEHVLACGGVYVAVRLAHPWLAGLLSPCCIATPSARKRGAICSLCASRMPYPFDTFMSVFEGHSAFSKPEEIFASWLAGRVDPLRAVLAVEELRRVLAEGDGAR